LTDSQQGRRVADGQKSRLVTLRMDGNGTVRLFRGGGQWLAFPDYTTSVNHTIRPIQELGRGGEGIVYALEGGSDTVAKIYHPSLRNSERERKLRAMIKSPPHDATRRLSPPHVSIAWPVDILYEQGAFAGFVMPRISDSPTIFQFYNPKLREQNPLSFDWRHLHRIGKNLATALNALHARGYVVGDVNQKNILVTSNALVTLVDTDSFQVHDETHGQTYRCPVGVPEYTPPELQRVRLGSVDRKPLHDCFGLSVLLFQLLLEGFHPFTGVSRNPTYSLPGEAYLHCITNGIFPYQINGECSPPPNAPEFSVLHPELQGMFLRSFVQGHRQPSARPTAREWIVAIDKAESELVECEKNPTHWYSRHTHKCHWCERESLKPLPVQQPLAAPPPRSSTAVTQSAPTPVPTLATVPWASLVPKSDSDVPWLVALIASIVGIAMVRLLPEYVGYVPYSPASHLGMNDGPANAGASLGLFVGLLLGLVGPIYHAKQSAESVLGMIAISLVMIPFTIVLGPLLIGFAGALAAWIITLLLPVVLGFIFGAAGGTLLAIAVQQYSRHDEIPAGCFLGALAGGIVAAVAWGTGNTFLANGLFVPLFAWAGYGVGRSFDMPVTAPSYPQTRSWLRTAAMCAGIFLLGLFVHPAIMGILGGAGLLVGLALAANTNSQKGTPALIGLAVCITAFLGLFAGSGLPPVKKPEVQPAMISTPTTEPTNTSQNHGRIEPVAVAPPSIRSGSPTDSGPSTRNEPSVRNEQTISPPPRTSPSSNIGHAEAVSSSLVNNSNAAAPPAVTTQRSPRTPQNPASQRHIDLSGDWQGTDNAQFRITDDGKTVTIRLTADPKAKKLRELSGTLTIPTDAHQSGTYAGMVDVLFFANSQRRTLRVTLWLRDANHLHLSCANWPEFDRNGRQSRDIKVTTFLTRQDRDN